MNILVVTNYFGGNKNYRRPLVYLVNRLSKKGYKFFVFSHKSQNSQEIGLHKCGNICRYYKKPILEITSLPYPISFSLPKLVKIIKQYDIDLLHTWWEVSLNVLSASIAANITNTPQIHTITGSGTRIGNFIVDTAARIYDQLFSRYVFQHADKIALISEALHYRTGKLGASPKKVITIKNGINLDRFNFEHHKKEGKKIRRKLEIDGKFVIGYVGRLDPVKGLNYLVEALTEIQNKEHIHLLIIGEGSLKKELQQQLSIRNIPHTFTGWTSQPEKFYPAMDLFVLPSLSEGVPNSLLEAMAMGIPSIGADTGAVKQIIGEKYVFPIKDVKTLRNKIEKIMNHNSLEKLGKRNRQRIQNKFSIEETVKAYEKIYQQVFDEMDQKPFI